MAHEIHFLTLDKYISMTLCPSHFAPSFASCFKFCRFKYASFNPLSPVREPRKWSPHLRSFSIYIDLTQGRESSKAKALLPNKIYHFFLTFLENWAQPAFSALSPQSLKSSVTNLGFPSSVLWLTVISLSGILSFFISGCLNSVCPLRPISSVISLAFSDSSTRYNLFLL